MFMVACIGIKQPYTNTQEISKNRYLWGMGKSRWRQEWKQNLSQNAIFVLSYVKALSKKKNLSNMEEPPKYDAEQTKT